MNPEFCGPPDRRDDDRLSAQLCRAVGAADFDYATLVDGVHRRAGRIRRRRALATGAIVAVVGPALLGGSAMVLPDLLPGGTNPMAPVETQVAALSDEATGDPATQAEPLAQEQASTAPPTETGARTAEEPPWQDTAPPLPEGGADEVDPDNAWDVPDARPTGVEYLDALGPPARGGDYHLVVPVSGPMACDGGQQRTSPLPAAGQSWSYFHDDLAGEVNIQVTGWEDSATARDGLREGTMTYCIRDADGGWERFDWAGHEGDEDYLLYEAASNGIDYSFAVVRQGDYLIGVTVTDATMDARLEVAAEVASKTAENMQALDPVHGRD